MFRFQQSKQPSSRRGLSLLYGAGVALLILLLVPLTQVLRPVKGQPVEIYKLEVVPPPPPPPPEELPPPPEAEEEEPPELEVPRPKPTLEQLEVSLNPGIGGDVGIDLAINLDLATESAEQLEELFDFGELDDIPRLVREGRFRYPPNSPRGRGEAFVRLLVYVEKDGRISVQKVIDYSHREFIQAAINMAEGSRFSSPMRKGQAVRSQYEWPIRIPLK
ncbi:energy transducer TonB [bacterium]|nr:energy transducer TonB [bacterium]